MIRNFANNDIATNGEHFLTGKEATNQNILRRLRLFLGEYFLNTSEGTPWFQSILGKVPQSVAETNIRQRILSSPDVIALTRFEFKYDAKTRKITINASVVDIHNEQFDFLFNEELL